MKALCKHICDAYNLSLDLNDENYYKEFSSIVDWYNVCTYFALNEEFIETFANKVRWDCLCKYQKLSETIIQNNINYIVWDRISQYQKLSENFIQIFANKLNWDHIVKFQKLSEDFIEKFIDRLNLTQVSKYQKLSKEFKQKYNITISNDNWLYKSIEEKLSHLSKYEIVDNHIIAYKSCRSDGYSTYNFHYKYEPNKEYEAHCNYNVNEEHSFGLSAGTKECALDYCEEKLFKIKINVDDIAVIIRNGEKLRCCKLYVMEEMLWENSI